MNDTPFVVEFRVTGSVDSSYIGYTQSIRVSMKSALSLISAHQREVTKVVDLTIKETSKKKD